MGVFEDMLARVLPEAGEEPTLDAKKVAQLLRRAVPQGSPEASSVPFGSLGAGAAIPPEMAPPLAPAAPIAAPIPIPRERPPEADASSVPPVTEMSAAMAPPGPPMNIQPQAPASEQPSTFGRIASGIMDGLHNNSNTLLALGAGMAGAPNLGQGISRAAAAAIPASQQDFKNRQLLQGNNATYNALIKRGVPQDIALAAMQNQKLLEQILPGALGPKNYTHQTLSDGTVIRLDPSGHEPPKVVYEADKTVPGKIGRDKFGNEIPGFLDPKNKKAYDISGKPATSSTVADQGAGDPSLTGPDYLASLDKPTASTVQAMVEGRLAPPSSQALRTPYWNKMLEHAAAYEPGFDMTKWGGRVAGVKDFYGGGKSAEMTRAANQTIHHVGELIDSMDKLKNTQYPAVNAVGNFVGQKVLGKGAVTEFLPNAHAVAEEMSKVFKGSNLSDAEIRQWESSLHADMSPEQQRAAVGKLMSLLNGSLTALETKRRSSLGDALSDQKGPLLDPHSRETMERVSKWIKGEGAAAPVAAAPAPAAPALPAAPPAAPITPPKPAATEAEYKALPSGATYIAPDGSVRKKP